MAGVYIHIPYCRQKCNYCNFYSIVSRRSAPQLIDAVIHEMHLRQNSAAHTDKAKTTINTLYIGGGTPSLLTEPLLRKLFQNIYSIFSLKEGSEITLEANPDDITPANLQLWKELGINRLSIGIQSFRDEDLHYLNRVHTAQKAIDCINQAMLAGFNDVTIDLIYGIPTLTDEQWINNLELFKSFGIPHLSAYSLTVEPHTALDVLIRKGSQKPVDEVQSTRQFLLLMDFMEKNSYLHYEISNFCLPGHFAKHNLSYWKSIDYLGFGPSAHSFNSTTRQWNVSSVTEYITSLEKDRVPFESETLTVTDKYNEFVMTRLRTMWGCNTDELHNLFGEKYMSYFIRQSEQYLHDKYMVLRDGNYILTTEGKLLADRISADLFFIEA